MDLLLICLVHFLITGALTETLRYMSRALLPRKHYQYVAEVLVMFQLAACSYENGGIVLRNYGVVTYALCLYCLNLAYTFVFDGHVNLCGIFEDSLSGVESNSSRLGSILKALLKAVAHIIGGILAVNYLRYLWTGWSASEIHLTEVNSFDKPCVSSVQVDTFFGMLAEFTGTFFVRTIKKLQLLGPSYSRFLNVAAIVCITVIGLDWTGMMTNPTLASVLNYNCVGHPFSEHVLVYWLPPLLATFLSHLLVQWLQSRSKQTASQHPDSHLSNRNGAVNKQRAKYRRQRGNATNGSLK